jgi:uncharacterized OsmC-like protein
LGEKKELLPLVKEHVQNRLKKEENPIIGTERVDLRLVDHLQLEAKKGEFTWIVDEPKERGGTNLGTNPLAYFLSGAASCFMMQFRMLAMAQEIEIRKLDVIARAHYTLSLGGEFKDIIYDVAVESNAADDQILALEEKAEELCFVHATFKGTRVKVITNLTLNGKKIL